MVYRNILGQVGFALAQPSLCQPGGCPLAHASALPAPQGRTGWGAWGGCALTPPATGCPGTLHGPRGWACKARLPECCASPSLCLLYEEPELGNRNRENTESFYSTPDQKKTQIPFIRCAHTKQTNWRHEDVFCYYSSFIYSSNNFNIPQIIETKKENRELTIRKKMERKISRCKLFTKEILLQIWF